MIGYYVHHHGTGHRHRATVLAHALVAAGEEVTGLSSLPAPADWPGAWVELPPDDLAPRPERPTAGGRLHWAPVGDPGVRERAARIAGWIADAGPRCVVADVSVEVTVLTRLHGVPVVVVVQPGRRGDPPHLLGYELADRLVAFWPPSACPMLRGLPEEVTRSVQPLGALSRFPTRSPERRVPGPRRVLVLNGSGGGDLGPAVLAGARSETPDWDWTFLGGTGGTWVDDPQGLLRRADVVVTHAGQNAVAEVAAVRRPAVIVPQDRPHDEQVTTASVLGGGPWPVTVVPDPARVSGWAAVLEATADLDGHRWADWCDGGAAERFVQVLAGVGERAGALR